MEILILLILILLNAFFAMAEIAIVTLNDKKIAKMGKEGHTGAKKVLKLIENSSDFLATIQVGITLSGFLTSASASQSYSAPLASLLEFTNLPKSFLDAASTIIVTIILSFFSLVFGELIPKKIAIQNAESVSFAVVGTLLMISKIFKPFIKLLSSSTNLIIRIMGIDPNKNDKIVTEEEILMMVDAGEEKGAIADYTKTMIANIFEFDDIPVEEVMTHRTDIVAIEDIENINSAVSEALKNGFSRIPVFHEDIDNIVGVIYVKDLLKYLCSDIPEKINLKSIMRPVMFVPNNKRCCKLFTEFTANHKQIAIVVDEYGGTEGLVTMEDLIETIVGNIQDEYDKEECDVKKIDENKFTVDGNTSLEEIESITGLKFQNSDYDTVAGLIIEKLGTIPKPGEHPSIEIADMVFTVQEVTDRKISSVEILKKSNDSITDEDN